MSISKRSKQLFLKADLVELIKIFDRESSVTSCNVLCNAVMFLCIHHM